MLKTILHGLTKALQFPSAHGVYINDLDQAKFWAVVGIYGVPFLLSCVLSFVILCKVHFKPTYVASWIAEWKFMQDPEKFKWTLPWLTVLMSLLIYFPVPLLGLFARAVYSDVNHVLGISLGVLTCAALLTIFAVFQWKSKQWRLNRTIRWCFVCALTLMCGLMLKIVFLSKPARNTPLSIVFVAINTIMVTFVAYALVQAKLKPINFYYGLREAEDVADNFSGFGICACRKKRKEKEEDSKESDEEALLGEKGITQDIVERPSTLNFRIVVYVASVLVLLAYGMCWFYTGDKFIFGAFIQVGAILTIDFTVFLCVFGDRLRSAAQIFLYLGLGRGVIVAVGHTYWFLGHCLMFVVLATSFGFSLIDKYSPRINTTEEKIKLFDELEQQNLFKVGAMSSTGVGNAIFRNVEIFALSVLSVLFSGSTVVSYYRSTVPMVLFNGPHPQFMAGTMAVALVVFTLLSFYQFRLYANNRFHVSGKIALISCASYLSAGLTGVLIWLETRSLTILIICLFMPLITYSVLHAFVLWRLNDYQVTAPGQAVPLWLILDTVLATLLTTVMGATLSVLVEPIWFGYTLATGLLLVGLTVVTMVQWFNSYRLRIGLLVTGSLAVVLFAGYLAIIWALELADVSYARTPFICGAFLYPIAVLTTTTAYKFADDGYKASRALKFYMLADAVLMVTFCACLAAFARDPSVGIGLMGFLVVSAALFTLPCLAQTRWVRVSYAAVILAVLGLALYIGLEDQGFLGFTVAIGVVWLCMLASTLSQHATHISLLAEKLGLKQFDPFSFLKELNSPDIFPVYAFVTTPGAHSPLRQNNARVLVVMALLSVTMLWGLVAVYFIQPLSIGLGAIAVSAVLMVWYTLETMTEPLVLFAAAVRQYGENSPEYFKALAQAKLTVSRCQSYAHKTALSQVYTASNADAVPNSLLTTDIDDIDWQAVRNARKRLAKQIPSVFNLGKASTIAFKNPFPDEQFSVDLDDEEEYLLVDGPTPSEQRCPDLSVQEALQLNLYLDNLTHLRYYRRSRFLSHVQLEMIRTSRVAAVERKREIITCLNSMVETKDQTLAELSAPSLFQRAQNELREIKARRERRLQNNKAQRLAQLQAQQQRMKVREQQLKASAPDIDKIVASGGKWRDPYFSAGPESIIKDKPTGKYSRWVKYPWVRASELKSLKENMPETESSEEKSETVPVFKEINPSIIQQGELGDCYVLSAMSVLSQFPDLLKNLIDVQYQDYGVFKVNFYHEGEPASVFVDEFFPSRDGNVPAFARSADNSLWVMLLEKAYAKLYGSYEVIESGFVDQALIDMTGGLGSRIDMTKPDTKQKIRNGLLWEVLVDFYSQGYLMGAGSPGGDDARPAGHEPVSSFGIVQGHAYAILHVIQIDTHKLVQLKNPWGKIEWKGNWSDNSPMWTNRLREKAKQSLKAKGKTLDNADVEDDGIFWMDFLDFTMHFEDVYICRFFSPETWVEHPLIVDEWVKGRDAGGCSNFRSVKISPQFLLTVSKPDTKIAISLSQQDSRGSYTDLAAISVEIYSNQGNLIRRGKTGELVAANPESYIYRREVLCEIVLQPPARGKGDGYTVLVSTFAKDIERKYTLQIFSSKGKPITFTRINANQ